MIRNVSSVACIPTVCVIQSFPEFGFLSLSSSCHWYVISIFKATSWSLLKALHQSVMTSWHCSQRLRLSSSHIIMLRPITLPFGSSTAHKCVLTPSIFCPGVYLVISGYERFWAVTQEASANQNITGPRRKPKEWLPCLPCKLYCSRAKSWWILNKTFTISNGAHSLMMRSNSCNKMNQITFFWMLESDSDHHVFHSEHSITW